MRIPDKIATKAKAWIALIGGAVTVTSEAIADNAIEANEVGNAVSVLVPLALAVYAVYKVPNRPEPSNG